MIDGKISGHSLHSSHHLPISWPPFIQLILSVLHQVAVEFFRFKGGFKRYQHLGQPATESQSKLMNQILRSGFQCQMHSKKRKWHVNDMQKKTWNHPVAKKMVKLHHLTLFREKNSNILKITTKKTLVSNSLVKLSHLIHLPLQSPELQWHLTGDAKHYPSDEKRSTEIQTSFYKKGLLHILEMMIQSPNSTKVESSFSANYPAWSWLLNCLWCSTGRADANRWHLRQHHGMIPWDIPALTNIPIITRMIPNPWNFSLFQCFWLVTSGSPKLIFWW